MPKVSDAGSRSKFASYNLLKGRRMLGYIVSFTAACTLKYFVSKKMNSS